MSDAKSVAEAIFAGCCANVGPLIGMELEPGEVSVETLSEPPEGELAVLPLSCEVDGEVRLQLSLASPLAEIVTLGRRMLEDEDPDTERELSSDDIDAVGEVLNLMSGAVDQVIRDQINSVLRSRPLPWWRTTEPGDNEFEAGEFHLGRGSMSVPGGTTVQLILRLPPSLFDQGAEAGSSASSGNVLLIDVSPEVAQGLTPILELARLTVQMMAADDADLARAAEDADTILLWAAAEGHGALCRGIRRSNKTWRTATILCMENPTRGQVVRAIESGASHVLRIPADETTLLRVLALARS